MATFREIIILIVICISLPMAEGAEVNAIELYHQQMVVREGRKLQIPCSFIVDDPDIDHKIQMEWTVMPTGSDRFTPIIRLDDTNLLPVDHPNTRASIDLMGVQNGHCSLVIDPVKPTDSGTYQVRISVDNQETKGTTQKINLRVREHGRRSLDSKKNRASQEISTNDIMDQTDSEDPDTRMLLKIIQVLKDKCMLIYIVIIGAVFFIVLILGGIAVFISRRRYKGILTEMSKSLQLKEEGRLPKILSVTTESSISIEMDTPHQSKEEKSPVTACHITPEMTREENPKQPDVKIEIEETTSGQSLKTDDQTSDQNIQSPKTKDRPSEEKIHSLKTEDLTPKAIIEPYFRKLTEEEPKEPAKKLHVIIDMEGPKADKKTDTAEPPPPARKPKEAKRPSSAPPVLCTTPTDKTKEDDLFYYDFLGIRWGYNWGKYWIVYPRYWG